LGLKIIRTDNLPQGERDCQRKNITILNNSNLAIQKLEDKIIHLKDYIIDEGYHGYDPYDILGSPVFKWPILKKRIFRFGAQQISRRIRFNLRSLMGVEKGYNPVTLGLCIQAYTYLSQVYTEDDFYPTEIDRLLCELIQLQSNGYSGPCWGYDFDWESRYSTIKAYEPTIVATGIITNALFENYRVTGNPKSLEIITGAEKFVMYDLNRIPQELGFCFSYSPNDHQVVFNATMKGARLLAQAYSKSGNDELKKVAADTVGFVMNHQDERGAWMYSHGDARNWVDNYHTGYILDEYIQLTGDKRFIQNRDKGADYYHQNFFEKDEIPKFYDKNIWPIDCTSASQSIMSMIRFGYIETAENVANWMIDNMQDKKGYFYFRKFKTYTSQISYMRWSNAWMFVALSKLLYIKKK
jgi:hypothetical protein